MFRFQGQDPTQHARLREALGRLDALVDWERRERSPTRGERMRQSVEPARDLFDRLGSPDAELRCLLVAGTKGKGSVAHLVGQGLRAAGERVGVYGSPHVERINERVRLGAALIEDGALAEAIEQALAAREAAVGAGSAAAQGTWFDLLTAAALVAFRDAGLRWAVLECGLGGRLDSTNAVHPMLGVITNIGLEHTAILGDTRAAIAREKAGIARPGVPLVSAVGGPDDEAARAVEEVARERRARLVRVTVGGTIAERNLGLARAVLEQLGISDAIPGTGAEGGLPGRMERFTWRGTPLVFDGAHVPSSLEQVCLELEAGGLVGRPRLVVLGLGADKDARAMLKVLRGRADRVLCTSVGDGPYARPGSLVAAARGVGVEAQAVEDPGAALDMAQRQAGATGWVLVTGSLHLVGRLRGRVAPSTRNT